MVFWGVEVRSGKPFTLKATESSGIRLHLSQATLGHGNGTERSILQCNVGNKSPVLLCALSPDKVDSHQLNLEFDETDEVIFSVLGPRSLHLTGYFIDTSTGFRPNDDDKTESYGEDIGYSDMGARSGDYDDYDYNDSFINDDDPYDHVSSTDDHEISIEEKKNGKGGRLRKKFEVFNSDSAEILARADESSDENYLEALNNGEYKIPRVRFSKRPLLSRLMTSWKARRSTLENGEPNAKSEKTSEARTRTHKTLDKREDKPLGDVNLSPVQKGGEVLSKENEEWKNMIERLKNENPTTKKCWNDYSSDVLPSQNGDATLSDKKRKMDMIEETSDVQKNQLECSETKKQAIDKNIEKEASTQKPLESETSSNGVILEDIEKAQFDGESTVKGKTVSMFDSNLGEAPLTCRLGGEEVIEGLSNGVEDVINTNTNTEERLREDVPKNEVEAVEIR